MQLGKRGERPDRRALEVELPEPGESAQRAQIPHARPGEREPLQARQARERGEVGDRLAVEVHVLHEAAEGVGEELQPLLEHRAGPAPHPEAAQVAPPEGDPRR